MASDGAGVGSVVSKPGVGLLAGGDVDTLLVIPVGLELGTLEEGEAVGKRGRLRVGAVGLDVKCVGLEVIGVVDPVGTTVFSHS